MDFFFVQRLLRFFLFLLDFVFRGLVLLAGLSHPYFLTPPPLSS